MGTWGPDIFESDESLDFVGNIADRLIGTIEKRLRDIGQNPVADAELHAAIAVYVSAAEKISAFRLSLSARRVDRWAKSYFEWFDREYPRFVEEDAVPAFRREREKQFIELARYAAGDEEIDKAIADHLEKFRRNEGKDFEL